MPTISQSDIREHLAGLSRANEFELIELRRTPVELKLRQIWTLMKSSDLLSAEARRESEVREVRARWARLYQAFGV